VSADVSAVEVRDAAPARLIDSAGTPDGGAMARFARIVVATFDAASDPVAVTPPLASAGTTLGPVVDEAILTEGGAVGEASGVVATLLPPQAVMAAATANAARRGFATFVRKRNIEPFL
jgi:hypothetical protein